MKTKRANQGFTLIEVMVAFTLFSLVMMSVIACWKAVVAGKITAETAAAAAQRARIGMRTVENALSCAEISAQNIQFYAFLNDTSGKFATLSVAARLPAEFPGSGLFGDDVMRRVSFDVEPGANNENNLVMNQWPLLEALDQANTPYPIVLARDVNVFMLEFWSKENGDWEVSFDPTNAFPPLIRVTLGVGHSAEHPDAPYDVIVRTVAMASVAH
ncbi:MAG TPA: prepilin-type N-terminal cleavage/methylation domain-containing protein [Candidatus Baltobacteraceae bacterium]|jgi:prepilin-type N-terminal cleavage/methylation domain-containing protein|nr:prepilin-type N-terminal cleavage/methylation domain-containing protein [Candidatus Baltobacteraceae bacterium]